MFFVALPLDILSLNALQHEAAHQGDLALEPHTHEAYWNVTNQTLDMYRAAIVDPSFTHFMKVSPKQHIGINRVALRRKVCKHRCILSCCGRILAVMLKLSPR